MAAAFACDAVPAAGWQSNGAGQEPVRVELQRRMDELRTHHKELADRLDQARQSGAEQMVAELEEKRERLQEIMHQVENAIVAERQSSGERNRPRRGQAAEENAEENAGAGDRPRLRESTPPAKEPAQRLRQLTERLRNAELASENLRKAGCEDLVEAVERRAAAWREERNAMLQRLEAERREATDRAAAEKSGATAGGDGSGRADRARQWEALRKLTDEVEALRQEVEALKKRR